MAARSLSDVRDLVGRRHGSLAFCDQYSRVMRLRSAS
jgi:hypothetical protein